jgi:cytochrome c oxidase assembly protein subunit 11
MTELPHDGDIVLNRRNRRMALTGIAVAFGMVGVAYAAVPLYQLFCQLTGFAGTPQIAESAPKGAIAREMKVRFDSNVARDLPWVVKAAGPVTDRIGNVDTVHYLATNNSDKAISGMATFNVTPDNAAIYFNKIECFCFTEQTLQPGETVEMPIVFFVDPDLADDRELATIKEITLSYTFYSSDNGES